jgi:transmembrane sensor
MPENHALIESLILKYARGRKFSKKEQAILDEWASQSDQHRRLLQLFRDPQWLRENLRMMEEVSTERMWENVLRLNREGADPAIVVPLRRWWRRPLSVAAVVLLVFVLGTLGALYMNRQWPGRDRGGMQKGELGIAASPGHFRVLLTLGNGNARVLDNLPNGDEVAVEGNAIVTTQDAHTLVYTSKPTMNESLVYHSLTTGKTEPFVLRLPDGSTVHLSYASRLRYPTAFDRARREVFLEGEAFFDIARDPSRPFVVHTEQSAIRVLGTSFDVSAYGNEPKNEIALFHGALVVFHGKDSVRMKAGQQVSVGGEGLSLGLMTDSARVLAWKDSCWRFDRTDLPAAVRQIARWHQMTVMNPQGIKGITLSGRYGHEEPLYQILRSMEQAESGNARLQIREDTIFISR